MKIDVKWNNVTQRDCCPGCGEFAGGPYEKTPCGPWFFLRGTWKPVCPTCAELHEPGLAPLVNTFHTFTVDDVWWRCAEESGKGVATADTLRLWISEMEQGASAV